MQTPFIKIVETAQFWAQESHTPLFTLTDEEKKELANTLIIYENGASTFYHINDAHTTRSILGLNQFKTKEGCNHFLKIAKQEIKDTKEYLKDKNSKSYLQLSNAELLIEWNEIKQKLFHFFSIYSQTEASNFSAFENKKENNAAIIITTNKIQNKEKNMFEQIGKIRLEMRKQIKPFFRIWIGKILNRIAKQNKMNLEDLFFYTIDEIENLFKKNKQINNHTLTERKQGYAVIITNQNRTIYTSKEYQEIKSHINKKNNLDKTTIIPPTTVTGSVASAGHVHGKARVIIHNKQNLKDEFLAFKQGEILVTDMTKPEMITLCKKAKGIITDEGGILCHAAIISREFNIPCIVGTKMATKIINTGDEIEIDTEKKQVNIITKANHKD